jgi:hypothetical protein
MRVQIEWDEIFIMEQNSELNDKASQMAAEMEKIDTEKRKAFAWLVGMGGAGMLVVVVYSFGAACWRAGISLLVNASGVALASLLMGGLLGFLFGIPRVLQGAQSPEQRGQSRSNADPEREEAPMFQENTSLEEISDWVTKGIVGFGFTQVTTLPEHLSKLAAWIASALRGPEDSVFALAVLLSFCVIGFMLSYLWTRLHLPTVFSNRYRKDLQA